MSLFSSDVEFPATLLALESYGGTLVFSPTEIAFYPTFKNHSEIHLPGDGIVDVALNMSDSRSEQITLPRLLLLKWLAFAFPKKTGSVATILTVQSEAEQVSFEIDGQTMDDIQSQIIPYLDQWEIVLH